MNNFHLGEEKTKISGIHIKRQMQIIYNDVHQNNCDILAVEGEKIGKIWSNGNKTNKPRH